MPKKPIITSFLTVTLLLTGTAFAQQPPYASHHEQMMRQHHPLPPRMDISRPFTDFPSSEELARMTPDPMTEEKISERFAKRKAMLTKMLDRDRKAAEKYAQDFSRFQQHQSDSLAKMMAKAEKRREQMLQQLDDQEQHVLENFRKRNAAAENADTEKSVARP